ncbi:hypothetical protein [Pontibacillus salipaludis]|uniref:Uncharacterized protein n=1 Tax=Pontibacillus salipaludis TaxID=1697394 RepID=A0ABQ1PWL1_9BACI|nr:hypothetical protein [Pontibacillus salipaludis]GGD05205.1 hypothetical protein GCM10011389_10890 [Pontibacillus salipaludis]
MSQLTLEDLIYQFDESKINVKQSYLDRMEYFEVKAYIPENVKGPLELGMRPEGEEFQRKLDLWCKYAVAIWDFDDLTWQQATQQLRNFRDADQPVGMKIWLHSDFRPESVTEYL